MSPDDLTGLYARTEFFPRLQAALALASQFNQPVALVYADLDHLLQVNSDYGHVAGDAYLKRVGDALQQVFRGDCFAARVGGDEFMAVAPNLSLDAVKNLGEDLLAQVNTRPLEVVQDGQTLQHPISVCVGIAYLPAGETTATVDDFTRRAYEAVLRAKESGGNSLNVYSPEEERDGLTGALKRSGLLARLDQVCTTATREHSTVAVINIDIDEFDSINKRFGHFTGDEVLRRVAGVLHSNLKEIGVVGRYAGDEFIVLLPNNRAETAFILAEEVRKVVEDTAIPIQIGEVKSKLNVRISGGVAEFPSDSSDHREVLRKAEEALYRAKQLGRNRICLPVSSQMVTKTSHFTQTQLEKLAELGRRTGKSEAYLLREALDDLLRKYDR